MEIKVNDIQVLEPVKFNYEELKEELQQKLQNYENLIYTEDNIKSAKSDRAMLNKLAKAINDERIRVNNQLLDPGKAFNNQCNELTGMVKKTSDCIDVQVKTFEEKEKFEKKEEIQKYFNEKVGHFKDVIAFEKIFEARWLNKTTTIKSIQTDIDHILSKTSSDLMTIETTVADKEIQKQCIAFYFDNITNPSILGLAIQKAREIEVKQKKIDELKQNETKCIKNQKNITEQSTQNITNNTPNVTTRQIDFRVWVNPEQMQILKKCLKENNIKYGPVPGFEKSNKPLILNYSESTDDYGDVRGQDLYNENEKINFSVYNLCECPEDAIIGRDLFTADDYISTLKKGIELAKKGYTSVITREVESEEE